ncbi:MAG: extracellular solute-binding protein, partial [Ruminococcus sp.]|nr:extracellular solute-binding protein [Ruminococcus sp.]
MRVGEVVDQAFLLQIGMTEKCGVLHMRGHVHVVEDSSAHGDFAGIIEADVERISALTVRPRKGIVAELFQTRGIALDLFHPHGIEGAAPDLADIPVQLQDERRPGAACYDRYFVDVSDLGDRLAVIALWDRQLGHVLGGTGIVADPLKTGEDWRWQTHLMNIPVTLEFRDKNINLTGEGYKSIEFKYADNFKNIFDLYINNSTTDKNQLGTVDVTSSMAEFALGKCAMVQNGNWGASQILGVTGNTVNSDDIRFMPIYMGIGGEESTGICIGTENYMCINSKASKEEQKAAADFLYWLFSSDKGKKFVTNGLVFISPFDTFAQGEEPDDPLAREVIRWMNT